MDFSLPHALLLGAYEPKITHPPDFPFAFRSRRENDTSAAIIEPFHLSFVAVVGQSLVCVLATARSDKQSSLMTNLNMLGPIEPFVWWSEW